MSGLQDILNRYPTGVCPVDGSQAALVALAQMVTQLRPLVTLTTPDGAAVSSTYDGTQPVLVLYSTPQTVRVFEDALGARWLWEG